MRRSTSAEDLSSTITPQPRRAGGSSLAALLAPTASSSLKSKTKYEERAALVAQALADADYPHGSALSQHRSVSPPSDPWGGGEFRALTEARRAHVVAARDQHRLKFNGDLDTDRRVRMHRLDPRNDVRFRARVVEQEGLFSRSYASRAASAARLEPPPLQGREGQGLQKRFVDARGVHARHMWVGDERVDAPAPHTAFNGVSVAAHQSFVSRLRNPTPRRPRSASAEPYRPPSGRDRSPSSRRGSWGWDRTPTRSSRRPSGDGAPAPAPAAASSRRSARSPSARRPSSSGTATNRSSFGPMTPKATSKKRWHHGINLADASAPGGSSNPFAPRSASTPTARSGAVASTRRLEELSRPRQVPRQPNSAPLPPARTHPIRPPQVYSSRTARRKPFTPKSERPNSMPERSSSVPSRRPASAAKLAASERAWVQPQGQAGGRLGRRDLLLEHSAPLGMLHSAGGSPSPEGKLSGGKVYVEHNGMLLLTDEKAARAAARAKGGGGGDDDDGELTGHEVSEERLQQTRTQKKLHEWRSADAFHDIRFRARVGERDIFQASGEKGWGAAGPTAAEQWFSDAPSSWGIQKAGAMPEVVSQPRRVSPAAPLAGREGKGTASLPASRLAHADHEGPMPLTVKGASYVVDSVWKESLRGSDDTARTADTASSPASSATRRAYKQRASPRFAAYKVNALGSPFESPIGSGSPHSAPRPRSAEARVNPFGARLAAADSPARPASPTPKP